MEENEVIVETTTDLVSDVAESTGIPKAGIFGIGVVVGGVAVTAAKLGWDKFQNWRIRRKFAEETDLDLDEIFDNDSGDEDEE